MRRIEHVGAQLQPSTANGLHKVGHQTFPSMAGSPVSGHCPDFKMPFNLYFRGQVCHTGRQKSPKSLPQNSHMLPAYACHCRTRWSCTIAEKSLQDVVVPERASRTLSGSCKTFPALGVCATSSACTCQVTYMLPMSISCQGSVWLLKCQGLWRCNSNEIHRHSWR